MTYRLAVGAMFKNERHALVEWIEHYLYHGADHFYLIDDGSTDDGVTILQPYVERGIVTLTTHSPPRQIGRQQAMYDKYVLPHLPETRWLLICDLDEFVWSPHAIDLNAELARCKGPAIFFVHTIFGSNGLIGYPKHGIVASYTRREPISPSSTSHSMKYFVKGSADCHGLFVHWPILGRGSMVNADQNFVLNHYMVQCLEFWQGVKMTRGVGEKRHATDPEDRDMGEFYNRDRNEVEDRRLYDQNKPLIARLFGEDVKPAA